MDTEPTPDPAPRATDDRGASLVEYAMLMALIAVVCISAVTFFGSAEAGSFTTSASSIVGAG
jgi:pilus assembly protein Flp/PilA